MLLESSSYIKNRHHFSNESEWIFLGEDILDPNGEYASNFFPNVTIEAKVGDEGGSTIIFVDNPKRNIRGKHIEIRGTELIRGVEILFPAILNEGEGIEIYNSYKSMDLLCLPITVNNVHTEIQQP